MCATEGEDSDGLFPERPVVADLGRFEEAARHLAQALRAHTPAAVVHGDDRITTLAPEEQPDPLTPLSRFDVLVGGVRNELVQGVLGILVGLAADEDGLGQVPNAQTDPLGRHA